MGNAGRLTELQESDVGQGTPASAFSDLYPPLKIYVFSPLGGESALLITSDDGYEWDSVQETLE